MAALNFKVSTGETGVTSTARTLITVVAPTNQRVKIKGLGVFGKGVSNTDSPVKIEWVTFTALTGGTANTVVVSKNDGDVGEAIQTQAAGNYGTTATPAEPTYTSAATVEVWEDHPQTGYVLIDHDHPFLVLKGGTGLAIRVTSVQNETLALILYCEE